jgi:DNA (cytosine-5)-methyltransferase 1
VGEYLRLVDATRPRWLVLENTPGLLTSNNGRDMAAVVMGLEDLGYGWSYRVVDGGSLGTPQRRERVVVVAHRGGDPRPALAVLGDEGPGREATAPYQVGRGARGPRAVASPDDNAGVLIWRKSARARKSIAEGGYETWVPATHGNTLTGFDGGLATRQTHLLLQDGRLRTLTLTEWERLSGFPDGWSTGMPTAERFGALGDCFHVGTAEWLGRRLMAVNTALAAHPALFDDLADRRPAPIEDQFALF